MKTQGRAETAELEGKSPFYTPPNQASRLFFNLRDRLNAARIRSAIKAHRLNTFDIYHFEQGMDPYRDGRWVRELRRMGKGIVSFYHGSDLRSRGAMKPVFEATHLHLTSEIDLLERIPGMKYLYLPFDEESITPSPRGNAEMLRIGHAARNRWYKGSDYIEAVVRGLADRYAIDWVMIENVSHNESIRLKAGCDLFIDQLTDRGGWGYGASAVEALALGIPVLTRINDKVGAFLGEHPFIPVTEGTLEAQLRLLIESSDLRAEYRTRGREWAVKRHGLNSVMSTLYNYYNEAGLV